MLFFNEEGRLSLGSFDNDVIKLANTAYFKFGSVIGANGLAGAFDGATMIAFNPSEKSVSAWEDITYYAEADWNANIKDTSSDAYNTYSNIRQGKGDPCRLIGYTADEIKNMSNATLQTVLNNAKYRMPTLEDNNALVGLEKQVYWSPDYTDHHVVKSGNATDPDYAIFPLDIAPGAEGSYNLVAAGRRNDSTGAVTSQGAGGRYWASNAYTSTRGYYLHIAELYVFPANYGVAAFGYAVRCVPAE